MKRYFFLSFLLVFHHCIWDSWDDFYKWAKIWQQEEIKRRYGSSYGNKDKIPEWEEEVKEYESLLEEKIEAGSKLSKVYRKLGESYAQVGSYEQCIKNLKLAIGYGFSDADTFFSLGLCMGNLAQINNWDYKYAKKAEKTFLKVLNLNPKYDKAKFELGLIYFFGFGKNNRYRVLGEYITVQQSAYRKKAIKLLRNYQFAEPNDPRSYFALANIYKTIGQVLLARNQMEILVETLKEENPQNYQEMKEYKSALHNIDLLSTSVP